MATGADFVEFFWAVNDHDPFEWQIRLVSSILDRGAWPDRITAPTGAGKSSVVEVHVFVSAVTATDSTRRLPRRLIATVDRRALVDNQVDRGIALQERLVAAPEGSLLREIRQALRSLRTWLPEGRDPDSDAGFDVAILRGGIPPDPVWRDDPAACMVICATPDMWGSRVLFRGYATSRNARPRDAGVLSMDSVVVVDEAHLSRQLVRTARRIRELQRTVEPLKVPTLQVVETTATPGGPDEELVEVGVTEGDLSRSGSDGALTLRLTTAKPVRLIESSHWPANTSAGRKSLAGELAERARALKADRDRTVGVMVNTVDLAVEVADQLKPLRVELIAGRMRPYDLEELRTRRPAMFTVEGDSNVDVVVATQTLEVGVDVDLAALVTELAPGSSIAQRAGRVNRLGLRDDALVEVIVPAEAKGWERGSGPYSGAELQRALEWLRRREADPNGLAPWTLAHDPGPDRDKDRRLWQRLELADTWVLAETSRPLFAEHELDLWLSDQLDNQDDSVSLVVRDRLPLDDSVALDLLRATPPLSHECFPVRIQTGKHLATGILSKEGLARCFRFRAGEVESIADGDDVKQGDILVVDAVHPVCRANIVTREPSDTATDVFEAVTDRRAPAVVRIVRTGRDSEGGASDTADACDRILDSIAEIVQEVPADTLGRRRSIADVVAEVADELAEVVQDAESLAPNSNALQRAVGCLRSRRKASTTVELGVADADGVLPWMVIRNLDGRMDTELRQTWNRQGIPITLVEHSTDVERRVGELAGAVGVPGPLEDALMLAGLHHDDGKADQRFQCMLQAADPAGLDRDLVLAKSGRGSATQNKSRSVRINPTGWRHEQLSVVIAGLALDDDPERDLILRLIGTSHGRGRGGFPHPVEQLLSPGTDQSTTAIAEDLFDLGLWDALMEKTQTRFGAWGCAYLEALLRAADCQVSEEVKR